MDLGFDTVKAENWSEVSDHHTRLWPWRKGSGQTTGKQCEYFVGWSDATWFSSGCAVFMRDTQGM